MAYGTFRVVNGKEKTEVMAKSSDFQFAKIWFIFDVKQDLRRKARLVIGGHMVDPQDNDVYSSHMKQESARILMTIADLNNLEVAV
eukprot:15329319-Ditylum_brightwellii.AAC.1